MSGTTSPASWPPTTRRRACSARPRTTPTLAEDYLTGLARARRHLRRSSSSRRTTRRRRACRPRPTSTGLGGRHGAGEGGDRHRSAHDRHRRAPFRRRSGRGGGALCRRVRHSARDRLRHGGRGALRRAPDYVRAFDIARDAGLGITVHAGELAGGKAWPPRSTTSARRASAMACAPSRTPTWCAASPRRAWCWNAARPPTSRLSVFDSFADHPFPALRAAGCR